MRRCCAGGSHAAVLCGGVTCGGAVRGLHVLSFLCHRPEAALKSLELEFIRNKERLQFFKWCSKAFGNVSVMPPETGSVHQVNLEYLSRVVMEDERFLYPDSVLGTDSHTTMGNGLGILSWG
ncbi:hypothetical protein FKM82_028839, partial [Ascaphus truei]